ncbi:MAG: tRNA (adenosine(37)-N6)-dimethylallyltransferase MiaA [Paracoccaceae bacterium]
MTALPEIHPDRPVLVAGATASGKSSLALRIAAEQGGVVVNADASQVYDCWRIITARPSVQEEGQTKHCLYGHVSWQQTYSAGDWLRDVLPLLDGPERPIIVGGTGLYFAALTKGMVQVPETPTALRAEADKMPLEDLLAGLDAATAARIDLQNRARVQRAWEVRQATGRGLAAWQADTPPPVLPVSEATCILIDAPKDWLEPRIRLRIDQMLDTGALEEVREMLPFFDQSLPAFRAIGVPELAAYLGGDLTLDAARERIAIATRQYAKRQRTWFRARMGGWHRFDPVPLV